MFARNIDLRNIQGHHKQMRWSHGAFCGKHWLDKATHKLFEHLYSLSRIANEFNGK